MSEVKSDESDLSVLLSLNWKELCMEKPNSGDVLLVRLGDGSITGAYCDSYGIEPYGVYATYDGCGGVAFDSNVLEWLKINE